MSSWNASSSSRIPESMEELLGRNNLFSAHWVLGYLMESAKAYLRGETTRDRFTADFAQVTIVCAEYYDEVQHRSLTSLHRRGAEQGDPRT